MSFAAPIISLAGSAIGAFSQLRAAEGFEPAAEAQERGAELLLEAADLQDAAAELVRSALPEIAGAAEDIEQAAYDQTIGARLLDRSAAGMAEAAAISRDIFGLNAALDEAETREDVRRLRWQHERERGDALARVAASGLAFLGSPARYVEEMDRVLEDEVGWLHRGLASRTAIADYEGNVAYLSGLAEAEGVRAQAMGALAGARTTYAAARGTRAQVRQMEAEAKTIEAGALQTRAQAAGGIAAAEGSRSQATATRGQAVGTALGGIGQFGEAFNWWRT